MLGRKAWLRMRSACAWLVVPVGLGLGALGYAPPAGAELLNTSDSGPRSHAVHPGAAASAHGDILRQAQQWLEQGQAKTAYGLLAPLEAELAGSMSFDWLFGQAALHSGRPSEAAFAFERCLAVDPMNGLCRLGIARAHISLQEVASAQDELTMLSQSSPPDAVKSVIADYMAQLSGTEVADQDTRLTSYIQIGVGYDSNINNATARDSMAIFPSLGSPVYSLDKEGQKKESGFAQARFNISYSTPIAPNWRFLTEANIAATGNWETHDYNTLVSDLSLGLARRANKHQFIGRVQGQNYRLGNHSYRNLLGVLGQYSYAMTNQSEISVFAQGSRLTYPGNTLRNANRYTVGASWTQGLANDRAVAYASVYGGKEDAGKSRAPDFYDHNFAGIRVGGMYLMTPRLQLEAGVGAERRRHDGQDPLFEKGRRDTYYDAYLGLNYAINRKLSLRPQYRYADNDSNSTLYGFRRHVVTMNLRYELF